MGYRRCVEVGLTPPGTGRRWRRRPSGRCHRRRGFSSRERSVAIPCWSSTQQVMAATTPARQRGFAVQRRYGSRDGARRPASAGCTVTATTPRGYSPARCCAPLPPHDFIGHHRSAISRGADDLAGWSPWRRTPRSGLMAAAMPPCRGGRFACPTPPVGRSVNQTAGGPRGSHAADVGQVDRRDGRRSGSSALAVPTARTSLVQPDVARGRDDREELRDTGSSSCGRCRRFGWPERCRSTRPQVVTSRPWCRCNPGSPTPDLAVTCGAVDSPRALTWSADDAGRLPTYAGVTSALGPGAAAPSRRAGRRAPPRRRAAHDPPAQHPPGRPQPPRTRGSTERRRRGPGATGPTAHHRMATPSRAPVRANPPSGSRVGRPPAVRRPRDDAEWDDMKRLGRPAHRLRRDAAHRPRHHGPARRTPTRPSGAPAGQSSSGVDHIDTSDYYGPYVVNDLIREALHPYPPELVLVTMSVRRRDGPAPGCRRFSPDGSGEAVHDNLGRLGVRRLGGVNLRFMDGHEGSFEEQWTVLADLRSVAGPGLRPRAEQLHRRSRSRSPRTSRRCRWCKNAYNVAHRGRRPHRRASTTGHLLRAVLPAGRLQPAAARRRRRRRRPPRRDTHAGRAGVAAPAVANILLIPGTSSVARLEENLAAGRLRSDETDLAELDAIGRR